MNSSWIDIQSTNGDTFSGYLTLPPRGTGPGLVLIQEIWGVNEHIRTVADQYALEGFVVLAPDVFWRQEQRVDLKYDEPGTQRAFELMNGLDQPKAIEDLVGAVNTLRSRDDVTGSVATVGYCMGGRLSFLTAVAGDVDAAVCYYPGGIQNVIDQADQTDTPLLFNFAGKDHMITQEVRDAVAAKVAQRDNVEIYLYADSDHGFNRWAGAPWNLHDAMLARGRVLQFLSHHAL